MTSFAGLTFFVFTPLSNASVFELGGYECLLDARHLIQGHVGQVALAVVLPSAQLQRHEAVTYIAPTRTSGAPSPLKSTTVPAHEQKVCSGRRSAQRRANRCRHH